MNQNNRVIGPIEERDWEALLNMKAFLKDFKNRSDPKYAERMPEYEDTYRQSIQYYLKDVA